MKSILKKTHLSREVSCENFNIESSKYEKHTNTALIKIKFGSICGSDIHAYFESDLYASFPTPRVLGYGASGIIIDIISDENADATGFTKGDLVSINPIIECEKCEMCRAGKTNLCVNRKMFGSDLTVYYKRKL